MKVSIFLTCCWQLRAVPAAAQCDPQELPKLVASDPAAGALLGFSVALDGDTLVVGARTDSPGGVFQAGSVYVYVRVGNDWLQQAKLVVSDTGSNQGFGISVAVLGDTILAARSGVAYIFVRNDGIWTEQARLTPSDTIGTVAFGISVALADDMAVVGDAGGSFPGQPAGQVLVYLKPPNGWSDMVETAQLTGSDTVGGDHFGARVSLSGSTIFVGASFDTHAGGQKAGSAYVFVEPLGGWSDMTETAKLTASNASADAQFGSSVSVDGDVAVVGAPNSNTAYVFVNTGGFWTQQARLTASDAGNDSFGFSVALSGDFALVGAMQAASGAGRAYVFIRPPAGWSNMTETFRLTASDSADSDLFGFSVALKGDRAAIGALRTDDACPQANPNCDTGSAYVFELCCLDSDGDGVPDCRDECPDDPDKTEPGICGCGVPDIDTNGSGVPDCLEAPAGQPADGDANGLADCGACGPGVIPVGLVAPAFLIGWRRRRLRPLTGRRPRRRTDRSVSWIRPSPFGHSPIG